MQKGSWNGKRFSLGKVDIMWVVLLCLFTIPAIWTLTPSGFFYTHDGTFHLIRLMQFYHELTSGQFPVRIATGLAYGYGYPIFNYMYPLIYYVGSFFHHLGLSFGDSMKLLIGTSMIGSIIVFYLWLRCHFDKLPAFIGALFYLYVPYRFLSTYVNGSFGSTLAYVFVPVIFLSIYKVTVSKNQQYLPLLSTSLAGLMLAHNVSALMFAPVILLYGLILAIQAKLNWKQVGLVIMAALVGLGISGFFVFPALLEAKFVRLGLGNTVPYSDHWATLGQLLYSKWTYGFSGVNEINRQSFQVGIAQWLVVLCSLVLIFLYLLLKKTIVKQLAVPLMMLVVFWGTIFMMIEQSDFIWRMVTPLQQIQYPWRLLAVTMLASSYLSAWLISQKPKILFVLPLVALILFANRNYLRTWEAKRYTDDFYIVDKFLYQGSTDIAWESLPAWVKERPCCFSQTIIQSPVELQNTRLNPLIAEVYRYEIDSDKPTKVNLALLYFPTWQVLVNGQEVKISPTEKYGLIDFYVPTGKSIIAVKIKNTAIQNFSNWVSTFSILTTIVWFVVNQKLTRNK